MAKFEELSGPSRQAVQYRGGHLQLIASAGAGKTEVVSHRVADLLADGVAPDGIIAFTFTERAAASLKSRIEKRVSERLGDKFLDLLNPMFVGTIHSYCFQLLQRHVPEYETYDVLDDNRLVAFLTREAGELGLYRQKGGLFRKIESLIANIEVVENELLTVEQLDDPFREVYETYRRILSDNRFLTYGQIIALAVEELGSQGVFDEVHGTLRHLIADEYQDVNPAQEALIERLALPPVHLCVVGDDDQSIYQWRGSDVSNIIGFADRYGSTNVKRFEIRENRRSRPEIIAAANAFSKTIEGRLPKKPMLPVRESAGTEEVVTWAAEDEGEQATRIARSVQAAHDELGYQYREIAILARGRVSLPAILAALEAEDIPVQPGGRTNLFLQPDADLFGRTICWLVGFNWRLSRYGWEADEVTLDDLMDRYTASFELSNAEARRVRKRLREWKEGVTDEDRQANLIREYYDLLGDLGVEHWNMEDSWVVNRMGTLARCSQVLVDYEATRRRSRPDHSQPGEVRGTQQGGYRYYKWLAVYVQNWAKGVYEDFEGEEDVTLDAVDLTTVHQAKGLEWPIVFVPSLTSKRFPSSKTGSKRDWKISTKLFDRERYEGTVNDERRLFYVGMTRARDYVSLSTFDRTEKQNAKASVFLSDVAGDSLSHPKRLSKPPPPEELADEDLVLEITFSDLSVYLECGLSYRLRRMLGFQPPLAPEIGYGKAVHHMLRRVADQTRSRRRTPTPKQLDRLFDDEFYLPAANRAGFRRMKERARKLVDRYVSEWESDLHSVWAVERPFELHLGNATVSGRADVIIHGANGKPERLSIVDYKTAADGHDSHDFQLQVYTDAGRKEGLTVEGAFVHDLKKAKRMAVPVDDPDVNAAEDRVRELVGGLRSKKYVPNPGERCTPCDVRAFCKHRAK